MTTASATAVLVSPTSAPGGAERALLNLARLLPKHNVATFVLLLQPGPFEEWLRDAGVDYEVVAMGRTRQVHRTLPVMARLATRSRRANVVVTNQGKGHAIAGPVPFVVGKPVIWWQHGIPGHSRIDRIAARVPAAAVVCGSKAALRAQHCLTPRRQVVLIHPGTDLGAVRAATGSGAAIRSRYGIGEAPFVGIVARLQAWKGQELFLRAAALVLQKVPACRFAVVGGAVLGWEGNYPADLRTLARALKLDDRVIFAGHQPDTYPWFDAIDIAITASVGEPFGLVTVEAMALGTPVVGVESSGTAEIIEHGTSGILVPPDDPAAMAAAIVDLLADSNRRQRISDAAALRAQTFSSHSTASRFADLIASITGLESTSAHDAVPAPQRID